MSVILSWPQCVKQPFNINIIFNAARISLHEITILVSTQPFLDEDGGNVAYCN